MEPTIGPHTTSKGVGIVDDPNATLDDPWHPNYVVDHKAYKIYQELLKSDTLTNKFVSTSEGELINLSILPHILREKIAHLPKIEQEQLEAQQSKYRSVYAKAIQHKLTAFGKKTVFRRGGYDVAQMKVIEVKKTEIIGLFGRMFSPEEVHRIIVEEFKMACSLDVVVAFRKNHIAQITTMIENFKRGSVETRLGVKKGRIEELVWLYQRVKSKYMSTDSKPDREYMLKLLDQLRKETDGDILKIEGNIDMKIEATVNTHLKQEILSELNLTQIILSRVAARMGLSGTRILTQLQRSAYNKFNGLLGDVRDAEYEEITYPSTQPYDFDEVGKNYKIITARDLQEQEEERKILENFKAVGPVEKTKEDLLQEIKKRKEEVNLKGAALDQYVLDQKIKDAEIKVDKDPEKRDSPLKRPIRPIKKKR